MNVNLLLLIASFLFTSVSHCCCAVQNGSPIFHPASSVPLGKFEDNEDGGKVDEQLYSRQLFVYGRRAQQQLQDSHVLIMGDGPVTAEVVKNLALAGVGRLSIIGSDGGASTRLKALSRNLVEYAKSLNPQIKV